MTFWAMGFNSPPERCLTFEDILAMGYRSNMQNAARIRAGGTTMSQFLPLRDGSDRVFVKPYMSADNSLTVPKATIAFRILSARP